MEYCLDHIKVEILSFAIIWMNHKDIMLTKAIRYRRTNAISSHLYVESEKVKLIKAESIMVATRRWVRKMGRCWLKWIIFQLSVLFSHSVVSDSLQPHGLQYARLPCPPPTPGVYSNSCPLSQWCHPTILSSVIPFSSHLQSFPESGSFPMNQFFTSGGQSIGVSASASVLPMNIQDWFPLGLTGSSPVWMWDLDHKEEGWAQKNWCLWTVVLGEDSWESLGLQGDQISGYKMCKFWGSNVQPGDDYS